MKIGALQKDVINNYKNICKLAKIPQVEKDVIPIWKLSYKKDNVEGFVSQLGTIETKNIRAKIDGENIYFLSKPFFKSVKNSLKKINKFLQGVTENLSTKDVVKKDEYYFLCRTQNDIDNINFLQAINRIGL